MLKSVIFVYFWTQIENHTLDAVCYSSSTSLSSTVNSQPIVQNGSVDRAGFWYGLISYIYLMCYKRDWLSPNKCFTCNPTPKTLDCRFRLFRHTTVVVNSVWPSQVVDARCPTSFTALDRPACRRLRHFMDCRYQPSDIINCSTDMEPWRGFSASAEFLAYLRLRCACHHYR